MSDIETRIKLVRLIKTLTFEEQRLLVQMIQDGFSSGTRRHYPIGNLSNKIEADYNGRLCEN
jgi:hypothetical protein